MTEQTTIPREETLTLDYDVLRKKALEYIEQLAGKTWTDYNTHDPGITVLESLVYALTDLSYRTNLSMEDLLASHPTPNPNPSFFRLEAILPSHPLTLEDTKKQLLDTNGIQNAWVRKVPEGKRKIYFNEHSKSLQGSGIDGNKVNLSGLYEVKFESIREGLENNIISLLMQDRNLCEDFVDASKIQGRNVTIHATVILSLEADVNTTLAEIYFRIYKFLNPKIVFDSLEHLQGNKISLEELYEGPLLNQGFLREDSLQKTREEGIIYFSDVLAAMWSSGEEETVLSIDYGDSPLVKVENDPQSHIGFVRLGENIQPILDIDGSEIEVLLETKERQSGNALVIDMEQVKIQYETLKQAYVDQTTHTRTPVEIPVGTQREITAYVSVQEELPRVYGVGNNVPPISGTPPERLAQSRQLQGFLLLFDQLMGNYLAQLSQVGSLFSYTPQQHTYFNRALKEITGIRGLLHEYTGTSESDWNDFMATTFPNKLTAILEPTHSKEFRQRRHQFLDHLLARFSDAYTDVSNFQDTDQVLGQKAIAAKEQLLSSYDQLSKQRGKGFNYGGSTMWGSGSEVTGYEQWVRAKLGISDTMRDFICSPENFFNRLLFGQNANDVVSINFDSYKALTSWTLELWVLPSQTTTFGTLIDLQNTSLENLVHITINSNAELLITLSSETPVVISDTAIQWDQWVQLAISYDQTTPSATIFINGSQIRDIALSGAIPSFVDSTVILGNNTTKNAVLKGVIAQLLLWGKALSESELLEKTMNTSIENDRNLKGLWKAEIINFQNLKDSATNHGMIQGNPLYLQQASFDGVNLLLQQFRENTDDTVSINFDSYNALTSWTLELWVLPSQNSNSSTLIDVQKNTNSENILCLEINNSADLLVKLATESQVTISNAAIQWDQWVHLAVSYDHDNIISTIFVDGNQVEQINLSESIPSFENAATYLGNNKGNTAAFKGAIARLALWGKEFSQSDLTNKEGILNGDEVDLEGLWKTLQYFRDQKASSNNHGTIEGTPQYQGTNGMGTFHLVEHILLRPKNAYSSNFLNPSSAFQNDPYSNQMTIICPKLAPPFNNRGYRDHFTHIVQSEAPAHVYVNILWVIYPSDLSQFESHYREWLEEQKAYLDFENPTNTNLYKMAHQNFIDTFNVLFTNYTGANLAAV